MDERRRFALLIANTNYTDPELIKLIAPADDAADLAQVLKRRDICGFEVLTFHDQPADRLRREIERFFLRERRHEDLLLLYFSGHGIKDLDGQLYFAAVDTELDHHQILQSTAISAKFVNEVMSRSRSRRQVLLLDCCHSGAFREGMLAKGEETAGATEQLQGQGRVVLTASNALQYSFEGDTVRGSGKRSIFTHALVEGLETGDADWDGDGRFSIDDVYCYVRERIKDQQQPTKIEMIEGELFLGENPKPKATRLPDDLLQDLSHDRREIRLGAVERLHVLLQSSHKGRAIMAQFELSRLQQDDDSQRVREAAKRYLDQYQAEAERQQREKAAPAEQERIAREKAEAKRWERERPRPPSESGGPQQENNHRTATIRAVVALFVVSIVVIVFLVIGRSPHTPAPETSVSDHTAAEAPDLGRTSEPQGGISVSGQPASSTSPVVTPAEPQPTVGDLGDAVNIARASNPLPDCNSNDFDVSAPTVKIPPPPSGCTYVVCVPALRRWLRLSPKASNYDDLHGPVNLYRVLCS